MNAPQKHRSPEIGAHMEICPPAMRGCPDSEGMGASDICFSTIDMKLVP